MPNWLIHTFVKHISKNTICRPIIIDLVTIKNHKVTKRQIIFIQDKIVQKSLMFSTFCVYSEDLNTKLVWYSNGRKEVGYQMVWFSNDI